MSVAIISAASVCTWGYNYNVKLYYSVSFSGTNIPGSLYTLQGYIGCGLASHFFDLPNNGGTGTVTSTSNQWNSSSDCNTATVLTLLCNTATIEISGEGIPFQAITFPISYVPLPVRLISFIAEPEGNKVKISWVRAAEVNNDYVSIERSLTGSDLQEIKGIKGTPNPSRQISYTYFDNEPVPEINIMKKTKTLLIFSDFRSEVD